MDPYQAKRPTKPRRSGTALLSLVLLGCGIVFFGIVLISCSFVINYADDFEVDDGSGIEAIVQSQFNYTQYWAGIPFLVTGVLVICSGVFQRQRGLTICSVIFCIISITINLFVLCLDGGNWHFWNSVQRRKTYWDSKNNVECTSSSKSCTCKDNTKTWEKFGYECDEISELSSLYGASVGSGILVAVFCIFSVLIITKSLSWKRIRGHRRSHYADEYYTEGPPGRRTPSFIDMPYAKRGAEYGEGLGLSTHGPPSGAPYKQQSVYRNYPY